MTSAAFLEDFHHVATIGATPDNGVDRQAATPEDAQTRHWFAGWVRDAGWELRVDGIGNMFGLLEWTPGAPYVLIGSHLDSQPLGGRFDGAYGVVAALHAARRLDAEVAEGGAAPRFNLAVVNWFNEEGGRFAPSIMGSSVFAGLLQREQMLDVADLQGITVREALDGIGYLGTSDGPEVAGYAEIHIEQGRILEREGISIGLVDSSWYTQKLDIEVLGEQSHTGATAMADRHDALVAASKIILMVHDVTAGVRRGGPRLIRGPADPRTELAHCGGPQGPPRRRPPLRRSGHRQGGPRQAHRGHRCAGTRARHQSQCEGLRHPADPPLPRRRA